MSYIDNIIKDKFMNSKAGLILKFMFVWQLLILSGADVFAADPIKIKGIVSDKENFPLPGAAVVIEGTANGTIADEKGEFTISAQKGQTLIVSFIGFQDASVKVTDQLTYFINLSEDTNFLEEVVVVGYDTQKKVNLTGSVSSVSTEQFKNRPIVQASTALQGVAPGVTVTTGGGEPGADSGSIRIRGLGTFGSSSASPLVLIDGVEGDMNALDPTTIDQISVLKDAASSAIYGSRAANGVILITTKRGKEGYSSVTYRGYVGWQTPTVIPENVSVEEYMMLKNETNVNDGASILYDEKYISEYRKNNWLDPDNYPMIDWQKRLITGSGFTHNHSVTMAASTDKIKTMTSFSYFKQDGIINYTDFQRYNFRNNMDVKLHEKLTLRLDISGSYGIKNSLTEQGGVFTFANARDPLMLAQWSDGNYAAFTGGSLNILPVIEKGEGGRRTQTNLKLNAALSLIYKPWKCLTLEGKVAPRFHWNTNHTFTDFITYYSDPYGTVSTATNVEHNSLYEGRSRFFYGNYQFTATFSKKFAKHHEIKVLAGASSETMDSSTLNATRYDYAYPDYESINAGADNELKENGGAREQLALLSYFGRVNYNYKERYLFEANIRFDGSSRFAKGNRWGIFPSFSAAWRVTEEPFMLNIKNTLTELKVRASYGTLGNQSIGGYYPTSQTLTISSMSANDRIWPIVALNTLANEDITWETSEMYDVGIDAVLWNKFKVTADWYYKTTYGILMKLDIPSSIGLSAPYQNAGKVRNIGWELGLGYNDSFGDFTYGVDANLSDVINEIIDMKGTSSGSVVRNQEGSSVNSFYGYECIGMARTQEDADRINATCPQFGTAIQAGDLIYKDQKTVDTDGDGVPDQADGKINEYDKTIIGSSIPRFTYGLSLNFGWKGLNLNAQFQGVGMADAYISGYYTQPNVQGGTYRKEHLDRWTSATPDGRFPRMSATSSNNLENSSFWMANAAYFRLKNLQLSYALPNSVVKKMKLKGLMFFANATNLLTVSNYYQGYDPESTYSSADSITTGASNYPLVSTYTFGLEVKF